jgi:hypothetical protein
MIAKTAHRCKRRIWERRTAAATDAVAWRKSLIQNALRAVTEPPGSSRRRTWGTFPACPGRGARFQRAVTGEVSAPACPDCGSWGVGNVPHVTGPAASPSGQPTLNCLADRTILTEEGPKNRAGRLGFAAKTGFQGRSEKNTPDRGFRRAILFDKAGFNARHLYQVSLSKKPRTFSDLREREQAA